MERHFLFNSNIFLTLYETYYFFQHLGLDKDMREGFRGHEHFEYTAQFCHLYDQNSFDNNFESMSLEDFEPIVQRVLAKPKISIYKGGKRDS